MTTKTIKVPNITCGHCTSTIERELGELEGITSVRANQDSKMVTIEFNSPPITEAQIASFLNEIGYPAET